MFLQRFVLACASLATRASAYEVIQAPCKVGKREFHDASSCIEKIIDLAGDGATFVARIRADQPETMANAVSAVEKVPGMNVQKTDPLMASLFEGGARFWNELTESAQRGHVVGWYVGESIGSYVGKLAGGATLGSLGFAAGSTAGAAVGFAASSIALSHAPLLGIAVPQLAALVTAVAMAQGAVLGAGVGTYAGVQAGCMAGSKLGGLLGGAVGSQVGSVLGPASAVHGMLFQLSDGMVLAIDYTRGKDGAAEALAYHLVVQPKT